MYSVNFIDKDSDGRITNERTVSLSLRVSEWGDGFRYDVLSNDSDIVCVQEFNPTTAGYVAMTEDEATRYGTIVMARMLTANPDIYEAISGWEDDAFVVASSILKKTFKE